MFKRLAYPLAPVALSCALAFASHAAVVSAPALSTPEGAREALLANVRFLISKGRSDLARAVINQVLAIEADDAETLVLFGDLELRAGRSPNAQKVLERLQQLDPKGVPTREMEALIRLYTVDRARLIQLRTLRDSGQYPQAQVIARELFPDGKAPGSLGREFADLLGPTVFAEPRRSAVISVPAVVGNKLAKHVRRPATLSTNRQAFQFGQSRGRLGLAPAQPARSYRPAAADVALSTAYQALNAGDDRGAEEGFRRVVKLRPRSAAAHGGLGIVHARRGQHSEALGFYAQAQKYERSRRSTTWTDLAKTSTYWQLIGLAREQLDRLDYSGARNTLRSALLSQPQETEAAVLLAEADLAQSQNDVAVSAYGALTRRTPADSRVWRGLLTSLLRQADASAESLDRAWIDAESAADAHRLDRSDLVPVADVRALARRQRDAGELKLAAATLDHGLRFAASDAWLRHDRARLFLEQGQVAQANRLMRDGDALAPQEPDMKHALAIVAMAQEQEQIALQSIDGIPESKRTEGIKALADSARFELAMHRLQDLSRSGARSDAAPSLDEAAALASHDASRQLRVARAEVLWGAQAAAASRLANIDVSQLSSQDRVARAVLLSDIGRHQDASQALSRLVADWPNTVPASVLINAQSLVASRQIDDFLDAKAVEPAREIASSALADWDRAGKRSALVSAAQANLWLQARSEQLALASANSALTEDPSSISALLVRARCARRNGGSRRCTRRLASVGQHLVTGSRRRAP